MEAINFPEVNTIYKAEGCGDLPTAKVGDEIVSCWIPTEEEIRYMVKCFEMGQVPLVYVDMLGIVPPVKVFMGSPFIRENPEDKKGGENDADKGL